MASRPARAGREAFQRRRVGTWPNSIGVDVGVGPADDAAIEPFDSPIQPDPLNPAIGSALTWVPLGRLLTDGRVLTQEQLDFALGEKAESGKRLGEIIVDLGFTTERAIAGALAEQYQLEFVDLEGLKLDRNAVTLLTETLARRYEALPIRILEDGVPLLAVADPTNLANADDLRFALGANFRLAVAERKQIDLAISRAYHQSLELVAEDSEQTTAHEEQVLHDIRDMASSAPTINLVNALLKSAVEEGASDIHFEPARTEMVVRIRVDGVMRELATIPKHMQPAVASRLKIMGKLDIADRRSPQDGRVAAFFGAGPIDLRIAVVTTTHGEQIVLRILGHGDRTPTLAELELEPKAEEAFKTSIEQPHGAVIVCGPTGSGKTTTLYGAVDHLNSPERVVMTIEDPVEYRLDGINQIEVDVKGGLTFPRGLRTILRSDPDVVLVGEIRDAETASIAIQAAMTGHLVLTSLHAYNAASAIASLRDMGVDPSMIASSLNSVVAQRLARRLCLECRNPYTAQAEELGLSATDGVNSEIVLYSAVGCTQCHGTGYSGRIALREVMIVQGEVRTLVERSAAEIFDAAVRQGMTTIRDDGLRVAVSGISSIEEIRRVTGTRLI